MSRPSARVREVHIKLGRPENELFIKVDWKDPKTIEEAIVLLQKRLLVLQNGDRKSTERHNKP
jgi:hypothetical protein